MAFAPGTRVGPCAVALKILPEPFAADPDRLARFTRKAQVLASGRRSVVTALAEETDTLQQQDASRVAAYERAARSYVAECRALKLADLPLREAHARLCEIAERRLPKTVRWQAADADAQ